jgi:hypothetical protein
MLNNYVLIFKTFKLIKYIVLILIMLSISFLILVFIALFNLSQIIRLIAFY